MFFRSGVSAAIHRVALPSLGSMMNEHAHSISRPNDPLHGLRTKQRRERKRLRILWHSTSFEPRIVRQSSQQQWRGNTLQPASTAVLGE